MTFSTEEFTFDIVYDFPVCPVCLSKRITHERFAWKQTYTWRFHCFTCQEFVRRELVAESDAGVQIVPSPKREEKHAAEVD